MRNRRKRWRNSFRQQGLRVTPPRLLVLDILTVAEHHLSAKEVYSLVVTRDASIGAASIYRTLNLLVSMELVKRNDFGEGFYRYELVRSETADDHVHLICEGCGRNIEIEIGTEILESINGLSETLSGVHQFELNRNRINYFGICSHCNSDNA